MPTYAYRCSECSHTFDAVQRFSDDALTECPECQGIVRRVFQPAAVLFKGSGWYITDSRPKDQSSESTSNSTSETSNGSKPSNKTAETSKDAPAATSNSSSNANAAS